MTRQNEATLDRRTAHEVWEQDMEENAAPHLEGPTHGQARGQPETITLTLTYAEALGVVEALQQRVAACPVQGADLAPADACRVVAERARVLAVVAEAVVQHEVAAALGQ
jgi:hypothetical protein